MLKELITATEVNEGKCEKALLYISAITCKGRGVGLRTGGGKPQSGEGDLPTVTPSSTIAFQYQHPTCFFFTQGTWKQNVIMLYTMQMYFITLF